MSIDLLPQDFDEIAALAVKSFWHGRSARGTGGQGGTRDRVIGGKNMDGFVSLVRAVTTHCGLPSHAVISEPGRVVLPGYFRPTKNWDVLVMHQGRLVAVFEFKSQVGSFGNNFNNRAEEVIGSGTDLWAAHHEGAFKANGDRRDNEPMLVPDAEPAINPEFQRDPRPPFLAWLMLLEDCTASTTAAAVSEPHYRVFSEFRSASYAQRYQLLCERLIERRLYASAPIYPTRRVGHRRLSDPLRGHEPADDVPRVRRPRRRRPLSPPFTPPPAPAPAPPPRAPQTPAPPP